MCDELHEAALSLWNGAQSLLTDDPMTLVKDVYVIKNVFDKLRDYSPWSYFDRKLWNNLNQFFNGGQQLTEADRTKLLEKLESGGDVKDNAGRLIDYVGRANSSKKIDFYVNATRSLLRDFIDLPMYFRIFNVIDRAVVEDLQFLSEHIKESDVPYGVEVQQLMSLGLMNENVGIDCKGYLFNFMARNVDKYAVSYENRARYPDLNDSAQHRPIEMNQPPRLAIASSNAIENIFLTTPVPAAE